jgi:pantoate--beta-alanine ligase
MSSRNAYLTDEERAVAPRLYTLLSSIGSELQAGKRDFEALVSRGIAELAAAGFRVDYLAIRRAENLGEPNRDCDELVVLAAVFLGRARLIDNVVVTV